MNLHPIEECMQTAALYIKRGATIYQQFLCSHCGVKQTMDTPNTWFYAGKCEECGKITDIKNDGCNYMMHLMVKR